MKHCNIPDVWTGEEALAFVAFLERLIQAIWRAHGHKMARCLEAVHTGHIDHHSHEEAWPVASDVPVLDYEPIPFPRR